MYEYSTAHMHAEVSFPAETSPLKITQILNLFFYPIYIKFSLFYLKCFTLFIELTKTWTGFPL